MPPTFEIPTSVLVALGLTGCIYSQVCLSMTPCLDQMETDQPDDTGDTYAVCLSVVDSQETGDTADTGCDSGDTGCAEPIDDTAPVGGRRGATIAQRTRAIEALVDTLPVDVLARLLR